MFGVRGYLLGVRCSGQVNITTANLKDFTNQDNQFDETLATHEYTNRETLAPKTMTPTRSDRTTKDLAEKGAKNNSNNISPSLAIVKQTQVGVETRKGKVEREQKRSHQILNLFSQFNRKTTIVRAYNSNEESTKNGVNTNSG